MKLVLVNGHRQRRVAGQHSSNSIDITSLDRVVKLCNVASILRPACPTEIPSTEIISKTQPS